METRGEDVIAGEELYCPPTPTVVTVVLLSPASSCQGRTSALFVSVLGRERRGVREWRVGWVSEGLGWLL
jgi:hypothetical protein